MKHLPISKHFIPIVLAFCTSYATAKIAEPVNLGETPWKFTKIIRQRTNLASQSSVTFNKQDIFNVQDGDINTEWSLGSQENGFWNIDLNESKTINNFAVIFKGDNIRFASIQLEASLDQTEWTPLHNGEIISCNLNKQGDFAKLSATGTVGYIEAVTNTSASIAIHPASYRYLRFKVKQCLSDKKEELPIRLCEIIINPVEHFTFHSDEELSSSGFNDEQWETVGIPHSYNVEDTYLNASTGERCWRGEGWYRKKVFFNGKDRDKLFFMEFQGVNVGTTVFVNGHAIPGNTKVEQPQTVTHVGSSLPFVVDITPYIQWDADNQIAIKVSNAPGTFFTWPGFGTNEGFGQGMGGIVCPVYLHKKNKVHIPSDCYSPLEKWGTYFGTISANKEEAIVRFQVNVENASQESKNIELRTYLKDAKGKKVLSRIDSKVIPGRSTQLFDRTDTIVKPHLWYPVGGSGTPYLYTIINEVYADGKLADRQEELWGIRKIEWDENYCYVNGERCFLQGFGNRNIYPGLSSALPASVQWQDIAYIAQCGGNTLRVGHQSPFKEAIKACDMYGVLLFINSGDGEWSLKNEPANTYKREYDRDIIIAYRNHPSVALWESNNGLAFDGVKYLPSYTLEEVRKWDYIQPRLVVNRDGYPPEWKKEDLLVIGYTNRYDKVEGYPSLNMEVYGANWSGLPSWCIARFDYDNEKEFSMDYVNNYLHDKANRACGWIHWMLAETYGEGYTIYLNGKRNQKSLGSCVMDGNRFPKLVYRIYEKALWVPYSKRPGVALQSHWNYSGIQDIDAWSNCPYVELFINGKSKGIVQPEEQTRRCTWQDIPWEAGTVEAIGLDESKRPVCSDKIASSGEPYAIEVTIEEPTPKPNGEKFELKANGSDAFIATAKIVDKDGNWCPFADNILKFEVEGEGSYKGSYNFYVTEGKPLDYHVPGDPELQAEGGLMRVAVRTTFKPGKIKVKASADGLLSGEASTKSKKI